MTNRLKGCLVIAVAVAFLATGVQVFAGEWSAEAMKKVEELKIMSRDKKDMAESMPGVKKITGEELKKWLDEGKKIVVLDNRVPTDYEKEHIPGAARLAPDDLLAKGRKAAEFLKKDDTIVFY